VRDGARLAGIVNFRVEKIIEAPIDLPCHCVQHVGALRQGQPAPRTRQCGTRGLHGGVDLVPPALGHGADQAAVHRRALVEVPLRLGGHEPVADKM